MTPVLNSCAALAWVSVIWRGGVRALRVLVVLLLIFDQASAPLHDHRHDGGADGLAPPHFFTADLPERHLETQDDFGARHAITAVKSEARAAPATGTEPSAAGMPQPTGDMAAPWRDARQNVPRAWPPDGAGLFQTHRNLPPGAQAPPLHT